MKPIPRKVKKYIHTLCQQHAWNMGVSHYTIDIVYMKEDKPDGEFDVHAEMTVDRRYLHGTLTIYPAAFAKWKKNDQSMNHVIAHEIAHLATDHLHRMATCVYKDEGEVKDAWEMLTESISQMSLTIKKLEEK